MRWLWIPAGREGQYGCGEGLEYLYSKLISLRSLGSPDDYRLGSLSSAHRPHVDGWGVFGAFGLAHLAVTGVGAFWMAGRGAGSSGWG